MLRYTGTLRGRILDQRERAHSTAAGTVTDASSVASTDEVQSHMVEPSEVRVP